MSTITPGTVLGRYVVVEVVGEGGMGVVYAGFDPQLDRKVAIKLLRTTAGDSDDRTRTEGRARLLREAQAMAKLSHPNVVPVYDAGTYDNVVFVAMEYVQGITLEGWLQERPRPWREVLAMYRQAGLGLAAAHEAGIIHRDFKPANVLLGKDGRPRVTDFGLARLTTSATTDVAPEAHQAAAGAELTPSRVTQFGRVMGSLGYMAPEQILGRPLTVAVDQFSFCVSLYEGLFGRSPFAGEDDVAIAQATLRGKVEPAPRDSHVPAWVQRLLKRGLTTDPKERHPSLRALLDALGRDPARRRRRFAAAATALLLAGAGVSSLAWTVRAQRAMCRDAGARLVGVWDGAIRDRGAAAFQRTGRAFARQAWDLARAQLDAYADAWTAMRTQACLATRVQRLETEQQYALRTACLDRRLEALGTLGQLFATADAATVEKASEAVARLPSLKACADLRALQEPRRAVPEAIAEAVKDTRRLVDQGSALLNAGQYAPAQEKLEAAGSRAAALRFAPLEGEAARALAEWERAMEHHDKERAQLERAVERAASVGDDDTLAHALGELVSAVGWRLGKDDEARALLPWVRGLLARVEDQDELAAALLESQGDLAWSEGAYEDSLARYREALAHVEKAKGPDSLQAAQLHHSIGWSLMDESRYEEARVEAQRALALRERLLGTDHPRLEADWSGLGTIARFLGDESEAHRCLSRALSIAEAALGPHHPALLRTLYNYSLMLNDFGHGGESLVQVTRAEALLAEQPHPLPEDVVLVRGMRSEALKALGRLPEATAAAREALARANAAFGRDQPQTTPYAADLAQLLCQQKMFAESLRIAEEARLGLLKTNRTAGDPYNDVLEKSACPLLGLGRPAEAKARLEEELARLTPQHLPRAEAPARFLLAQALWANRQAEPARAEAATAQRQFEQVRQPKQAAEVAAWLQSKAGGAPKGDGNGPKTGAP